MNINDMNKQLQQQGEDFKKEQTAKIISGVLANAPDKQPGYRELGDGKWAIGDRVYPVVRPRRGTLIVLK